LKPGQLFCKSIILFFAYLYFLKHYFMTNRRSFIKQSAGAIALASFTDRLFAAQFEEQLQRITHLSPEVAAEDEDFWSWVQQQYPVSANIINLNNGGLSPHPKPVQDALFRYDEMSNEAPSYYMWRILDKGRETLRNKLADLAGCAPEEIAINRNATEAVDTAIFGLNLKAGDEVVMTKQDYPNMVHAWRQREKRDGIKIVWINFELPIEDEDAIVKQFVKAFTANTKIVHITHIINWTGQILPVKKIAAEAHKRNIEVLVDGAQSFGHFEFRLDDLNCDYYGTSLHKWLCAPFGTGMLFVKKEKIKNLWPLFPNDKPDSEDIRKFEVLGTRSFATEQATGQAINFHLAIGSKRKEARLRYLKDYWAKQVISVPGVKIHTSLKPEFSCAIANISVAGIKTADLEAKLLNEYRIHTSPIVWENIDGVRITPHVYTRIADLDILVRAIKEIADAVSKK
jgi:selenocysteine lyase/cysteine desulfurase